MEIRLRKENVVEVAQGFTPLLLEKVAPIKRLDQLKVALNDAQIIMRQLMFHLFYGMVSVRVTLFLPATRMD